MAKVIQSFRSKIVSLPVANIIPRRKIGHEQRTGVSFRQVAASMAEVGIIEALVVHPSKDGTFALLDGHVRLDILRERNVLTVDCLLSTDDEAYTYNRRVNSIAPVAQHLMLLKALEKGLSEERIAKALHINVTSIRRKRNMLDGVCPEALGLLHDHRISANTFALLKRMKPLRQVEAAEHMVASSTYGAGFVRALLFATKDTDLAEKSGAANNYGATQASKDRFVGESESLLKDLKALEADLGKEMLSLTVFEAYIARLLGNVKVSRYIERRHAEIGKVLKPSSAHC